MSTPAAKFPAAVWNGLSANWQRGSLGDNESPNHQDWDQAVAELIAIENSLATVTTIAAAGNTAALATSATTGFGYIPKVAGVPTGVPINTPAGFVPWVYDSTNHKISIYDGGWKQSVALS
jgi:hypothetical protein